MMNFITEFVFVCSSMLSKLSIIRILFSQKIHLIRFFFLQVNKKFPHADRKNESMIKIRILYGFYMVSFHQPISISVIDLNLKNEMMA